MLIKTDTIQKIQESKLDIFPGVHFAPKISGKGPTKEEIVQWFKPLSHVSVLQFKALYGCG